MKKGYHIERVSGTAEYRLPASMNREIGRILVSFAYFEHCVQEMIWDAMAISDAVGRIAVREPRVTDRLEMLRDMIGLRHGSWDEALYKAIYQRADLFAAKRHLLAHGRWFHHKAMDEWHVQMTRGAWPKDRAELVAGSKKIVPESRVVTMDELREAVAEIEELISDLKRLRASAVEEEPRPPQESQ